MTTIAKNLNDQIIDQKIVDSLKILKKLRLKIIDQKIVDSLKILKKLRQAVLWFWFFFKLFSNRTEGSLILKFEKTPELTILWK